MMIMEINRCLGTSFLLVIVGSDVTSTGWRPPFTTTIAKSKKSSAFRFNTFLSRNNNGAEYSTSKGMNNLAEKKGERTEGDAITTSADKDLAEMTNSLHISKTKVCVVSVQQKVEASSGDKGVPGFPEFPPFWFGEEGFVSWQRNKCSTTNLAKKKSNPKVGRRQTQIRREAVNRAGLVKRRRAGIRDTLRLRAIKKSEDRKRRLHMLKHKRQMVALRKSLASLSCCHDC